MVGGFGVETGGAVFDRYVDERSALDGFSKRNQNQLQVDVHGILVLVNRYF